MGKHDRPMGDAVHPPNLVFRKDSTVEQRRPLFERVTATHGKRAYWYVGHDAHTHYFVTYRDQKKDRCFEVPVHDGDLL